MQVKKCKLADLREPKENVRMHTEVQLKEFERSIKMFGQFRPIVIDEENIIRAGVGLYRTLQRMGYTEADTYQISGLTENQKKKLMIADNKIYALGVDDLENLNRFIEDLHDDLDIPGFDEDILRTMVAEAEEVTARVMEYGNFGKEDIQAIKEAGERRDERIAAKRNEIAGHSEKDEPENTAASSQAHVVCPKCGETIWL